MRDRPASAAAGTPEGPQGPVTPGSGDGAPPERIHRNVKLLGINSLLTDVSSESVNSVLPLYLTRVMGMSPQAYGIFEGVYQGMTALLRIVGGRVADRTQKHKEVAGAGYALSAATKIGLLASTTVAPTAAALFADRVGKGIRTAPRDALISLSSPPERLGASFGVHRALDMVGALLGPILAFALLRYNPGAYDSVFVVSLCVAVLGLGIIAFFVQNPPRPPAGASPAAAAPARPGSRQLLGNKTFRRILLAGALLSLVTVSDAFIYLVWEQKTGMNPTAFPLLFVGTALAYLLLAIPLGRLADRIGRAPVFFAGHVLLIGCYLVLRASGADSGFLNIALILGLLGTYYAATDGVLMAMASAVIPAGLRSSGLAWLTTATVLAKLGASSLFGKMYQWYGPTEALTLFLAGLVVVLPVAFLVLFRSPNRPEVHAR
ncbi:MAG: MFS transporter [Actinomycetota bacterium]